MSIWMLLGLAIVATVGGMQYLKGWAPTARPWVWRVLLPVVAVAWALVVVAVAKVQLLTALLYGGVILALCQLGYEVVLEGVVSLMKASIELIRRKIADLAGGGGGR
jgi:hypothetical protein